MVNIMNKILTLSAVFILAACGVSSSDGVVSRGKNSSGFMGMTTNSDVEVDGEKAFKGIKDVVVGSFKVGFAESSIAKNQAKGSFLTGNGGLGKATGKVKLTGVSDSLKAQITDAAYSDFVAKLKANGYNVVDRSKFTSSEQYGKAKQYDFPYMDDKSSLLSEYGKTKFYQPTSFGKQGIMFMNDIQDVSGGFAFGNGEQQAQDFASKNNIQVISATYFVDFTAAGGHAGVSSASVSVGQNLAVTTGKVRFAKEGTSTFTVGTPTVTLGQPIESGKVYGKVVDKTSTTDKVVQESLNVLTAVLSGGTNRSKNFEIEANPSKYKAQSVDILKDANKALISKAASLR